MRDPSAIGQTADDEMSLNEQMADSNDEMTE